MSTILVTGGAGFIGCAIAPALLESFDRVVVVDNLHPQVHPGRRRPDSLPSAAEFLVEDVTQADAWDAVLTRGPFDAVVHLAAETGTGQSFSEGSRHAMVNVVGTTQMLDALARETTLPHRILLASSRAVYGEGLWQAPDGTQFSPGQRHAQQLSQRLWDFDGTPLPMCAQQTPATPVSTYGVTKYTQEQLLTSWARPRGIDPIILRFQNVYGPGQSLSNPYTGIVSLFCRLAREGKSIPLYEDGQVRRDFIHVKDVVRSVLIALNGPSSSAPLDVGSGSWTTIQQLSRIIANHYGAPEPTITGQYRFGDVRHAWADISASRDLLQWRPDIALNDGLVDLAGWIDEQLG